MIKSVRIRWAGHVARMGDHWEDQDLGGGTILKWILERYDAILWIGLIWLRIRTSGGPL
jgi:hypothetical protein